MPHSVQIQRLMEKITSVCRAGHREFESHDQEFGLGASFDVGADCRVILVAHQLGLMVASILPIFVPPERRTAMTELVNRINNMTVSGMLEMTPQDGQMRLRHCIAAPPGSIACKIIQETLIHNLAMTKVAIPKLRAFLEDGMSAEQAAEEWLLVGERSSTSPQAQENAVPPRRYPPRFNLN